MRISQRKQQELIKHYVPTAERRTAVSARVQVISVSLKVEVTKKAVPFYGNSFELFQQ